MAFVSVIIPCYNAEKYIGRCLDSMNNQSYKNFDVILIDDCSVDGTANVIENYRQTHSLDIKYIKNEVNSGPAKSRNNGIKLSDSEYIAFCDCDDWYEEDYLSLIVAAILDKNADMVFCNSQKVLTNGKIIPIDNIGNSFTSASKNDILTVGVDSLWCLVVKRGIILETPMPDIRNGEDMAIIPLMIMKSNRFAFVKKPIYNYLCRPGSLSLTVNEKVVKSLVFSFEYIYEHRQDCFEKEIEYIGIKNVIYGVLLNHFKCSSDKEYARVILQSFEEKYPDWAKNSYINNLTIFKKIFIKMAKKRNFFMLKLMCKVHTRLIGTEG